MHATGCQPGFLARDRDAGLIVELGLHSRFDFKRHDPTDPYKRLWLRMCIEYARQQRTERALSASLHGVCAHMLDTIARASTTTQIPEAALERSRALVASRIHLLLPWTGDDNTDDARDKLRQAWINTFGDPSDPEVQAKIDAVVAYLQE